MRPEVPDELSELEARWRLREREWARKLGRLRLGVEPIEEQLARYRRVTWALSVFPGIIALIIFSLFFAFGRPDIGFFVVVILFVPMILFAWLGFYKLERRAAAYQAERLDHERQRASLLQEIAEKSTTP